MKNFFGIEESDFFDKNVVKLICGIAGSAKSSNIHKIFSEKGIEYKRVTSTHRLKKDAENRYDMECQTIAGGLFTTENGLFYSDFKDGECEHVVIDEVLQASPRVFAWCRENVGKVNIIITTDEKQMLSVGAGNRIVDAMNAMAGEIPCIKVELEKTYRAINWDTEKLYYDLYKSVDYDKDLWYNYRKKFNFIKFDELNYDSRHIYICHTNAIESYVYNYFGLHDRYDVELLPKGRIAGREITNKRKYPICPQEKVAKGIGSYFQIANVATPTRYQGSEVQVGQRLYYLVESCSRVTNRELYTVVTRCKDIKSLSVVYVNAESEVFTEFCGKKIIDEAIATIKEDVMLPSGITLGQALSKRDGKNLLLSDQDIEFIRRLIPSTDELHYNQDFFFCNGVMIRGGLGDEEEEARNKAPKSEVTIQSLIKKEPEFMLEYTEEALQIIGRKKDMFGRSIDIIQCATPAVKNFESRFNYDCEFDLFSSYPHIFKNERMPIDGRLYRAESKDRINYYLYRRNPFYEVLEEDCIITDNMKAFVDLFDRQETEFLFSVDCKQGSRMGEWGVSKSIKSAAGKAAVKNIRWGYLQRSFYTSHYGEDSEIQYYIRDQRCVFELLMCHIKSCQLAIVMNAQLQMYGNISEGCIIADALHFNYNEEGIRDLIEYMEEELPEYKYRIRSKGGEIVFKNYNDPPDSKKLTAERNKIYRYNKKYGKK